MLTVIRRFPLLIVAAIALSCCSMPQQGTTTTTRTESDDMALYRSVLDRVHESYVEPVSDDKLFTDALKGMLNGLDPHSDYMTQSEYEDMLDDNSGEFAGIGAELTREDGRPKVIAPIEDTPASPAGVKPGDVIVKISGKLTDGLSLKDVVDQLRGTAGTSVTITIGRKEEKQFDVTLTRAVIRVASVKWKLEPRRVGYD